MTAIAGRFYSDLKCAISGLALKNRTRIGAPALRCHDFVIPWQYRTHTPRVSQNDPDLLSQDEAPNGLRSSLFQQCCDSTQGIAAMRQAEGVIRKICSC